MTAVRDVLDYGGPLADPEFISWLASMPEDVRPEVDAFWYHVGCAVHHSHHLPRLTRSGANDLTGTFRRATGLPDLLGPRATSAPLPGPVLSGIQNAGSGDGSSHRNPSAPPAAAIHDERTKRGNHLLAESLHWGLSPDWVSVPERACAARPGDRHPNGPGARCPNGPCHQIR